ncbi:MAG TPA: helix-turn-helix domain-containing protein [Kribbella sp.]
MATSGRAGARTHVQRSDTTRALVLNAAVECLVADGYERTTTVSVQSRAGVSRGRLLHQFPSRAALLVAAAQYLASTRITEMELWISRSEARMADDGERCDRATELLWETFAQPYFWAAMELWHAARTDAALRAELLATERQLGRAIKNVVATMYGPRLSSHPDFDELSELLFTSMRGAALTYALQARDHMTDRRLTMWRRCARATLLGERNGLQYSQA